MKPYKIVLLGKCGVGKTALMKQFMHNTFPEHYEPTVEDFYTRVIQCPDRLFRAMDIFDTSGTNEFIAMKHLRIEQAEFFFVIYSVDDLQSFNEAMDIVESVQTTKGNADIGLAVIGNKVDLNDREVTPEIVSDMQIKLGFAHMETSAKKNINLEAMFDLVLKARFPGSEASLAEGTVEQEEEMGDDEVFTPPRTPTKNMFKRANSLSVFFGYFKSDPESPREKRFGSSSLV